jgi:hypothetical protein
MDEMRTLNLSPEDAVQYQKAIAHCLAEIDQLREQMAPLQKEALSRAITFLFFSPLNRRGQTRIADVAGTGGHDAVRHRRAGSDAHVHESRARGGPDNRPAVVH